MISDSLRFVFVHIPRTGGTSVEVALGDHARRPIARTVNGSTVLPHKHDTALELRALLGSAWEQYFRFSIVRNPWERMLSDYHFFRSIGPQLYPEFSAREQQLADDAQRLPLDEWLAHNAANLRMCQLDYLTDAHGKLLVDSICRFEDLEADFAAVCQKIGVDVALPWLNRTLHPPIEAAYSAMGAEIVRRHCSHDIAHFDYRFPLVKAKV